MGNVLKFLGWFIVVALASFVLFWVWCEVEHNKTAVEYAQDEWGWFKNDESTNEDIIVDAETGEVEVPASIGF